MLGGTVLIYNNKVPLYKTLLASPFRFAVCSPRRLSHLAVKCWKLSIGWLVEESWSDHVGFGEEQDLTNPALRP